MTYVSAILLKASMEISSILLTKKVSQILVKFLLVSNQGLDFEQGFSIHFQKAS
jgi:hypothetical protein